jgi:nicotinamidase-related amidase
LQTAYINRVATAVPPYDVHDAFRRFTQSLFRHDRRNSLLFERMAGKSGIEHRYSCFAPSNLPEGDCVDAEGFRQKLIDNIVGVAKAGRAFGLPIVHSTVNVKTGLNKPPIPHLRKVLGDLPTFDRTSINAWEDVEFAQAVTATGRKKLVMTALWTEACLTFPALDALQAGYEVYVVADAIGGTSVEAHQAALRRIEQAGGKMISLMQLICELQRDWGRKETVPAFLKVAGEIPGTFATQLAYDNDMATDG